MNQTDLIETAKRSLLEIPPKVDPVMSEAAKAIAISARKARTIGRPIFEAKKRRNIEIMCVWTRSKAG